MSTALQQFWTKEDFFAWVQTQDGRYEFDGEQPVAMTGGTNTHSALHRNILLALAPRLGNGPCQVLGSDAGVQTIGEAIRYPDALVTCTPLRGEALTVDGVVVVFEVISPTSGRLDRVVKLREYAAVPTIRQYVIVESTGVALTALSRTRADAPWTATGLTSGDNLDLPEIGIIVPVDELYQGVAV